MKDGQRSFLQHIETLFDAGAIGEHTDRQLLDLSTGRDRTTAELAFTVLVKRHGPMIFRACRAILHDPHAAEDAFQATFLVLVGQVPIIERTPVSLVARTVHAAVGLAPGQAVAGATASTVALMEGALRMMF
jgi:hypothetical protein